MPKRFEGKVASCTTAVISDWTGMAGAKLRIRNEVRVL